MHPRIRRDPRTGPGQSRRPPCHADVVEARDFGPERGSTPRWPSSAFSRARRPAAHQGVAVTDERDVRRCRVRTGESVIRRCSPRWPLPSTIPSPTFVTTPPSPALALGHPRAVGVSRDGRAPVVRRRGHASRSEEATWTPAVIPALMKLAPGRRRAFSHRSRAATHRCGSAPRPAKRWAAENGLFLERIAKRASPSSLETGHTERCLAAPPRLHVSRFQLIQAHSQPASVTKRMLQQSRHIRPKTPARGECAVGGKSASRARSPVAFPFVLTTAWVALTVPSVGWPAFSDGSSSWNACSSSWFEKFVKASFSRVTMPWRGGGTLERKVRHLDCVQPGISRTAHHLHTPACTELGSFLQNKFKCPCHGSGYYTGSALQGGALGNAGEDHHRPGAPTVGVVFIRSAASGAIPTRSSRYEDVGSRATRWRIDKVGDG